MDKLPMTKPNTSHSLKKKALSVARKLLINNTHKKKKPLKTKRPSLSSSKWHFTVDLDRIEHHQYRTSLAARGRLAQQFSPTPTIATLLEGAVLWAPSSSSSASSTNSSSEPLFSLTLRGSSFGHQTVLNADDDEDKKQQCEMLILLCDMQRPGDETTTPVVLKLRYPMHAIEDEMDRTRRMHADASALMPTIHAFVQLKVAARTYGGICMQRLDHTATELLFPSTALFKQQETLLDQAVRFRNYHAAANNTPKRNDGVAIHHQTTKNDDDAPLLLAAEEGLIAHLQTAVMLACLRLLRRLHIEAGWCHGDSHLGNFLIDSRSWRVYMIDFERAFECSKQHQWFLDDQELFGHASGLLRTEPRWDGWDLDNALPLYTQLHPESPWCRLKKEEPELLRLVPICTCFINNDLNERLAACDLCQSPLNRANAERYYNSSTSCCSSPELAAITHVRKIVRKAKRAMEQKLMAPLLSSLTLHHERVHDLLRVFQRGGKLQHSSLLLLRQSATGLSPLFLNFHGLTPEDTVVLRERLCDVLYKPTLLLIAATTTRGDENQQQENTTTTSYALLERLGLLQSPPSALVLLP